MVKSPLPPLLGTENIQLAVLPLALQGSHTAQPEFSQTSSLRFHISTQRKRGSFLCKVDMELKTSL